MKLRPLHDNLTVLLDPRVERSASIIFPNRGRVRTGQVLHTGPGKWQKGRRIPIGVEIGERIAFLQANFEHSPGRQLAGVVSEIDENVRLLNAKDVLFVFHGELDVR